MLTPLRIVRDSLPSAGKTTRQEWPAPARCSSQTRLLRVDPPRAGSCDAFEVRRIRMEERRPSESSAIGLALGEHLASLVFRHRLDLLQQLGVFGRLGAAHLDQLDTLGQFR